MTQSILLVIIVVGTITLATRRSSVGILLGGVDIYDKEMIECYRDIVTILVIVQHCAGELGINIFIPSRGIDVAIFLLLPGFGLTGSFSRRGMRGFLKSKLWGIWVPFLLFYTGIYLLHDKHNYKNLFLNIYSTRQDDYWYAHYVLRCYLVFWVAFRFFCKYRWYLLVAFIIYTFSCMDATGAEQCLSFPIGVLLSERREEFLLLSKRKYVQLIAIFCIIRLVLLVIKRSPEMRDLCGTPSYSLVEFGMKLPLGISVTIILWLLPHRWVINPVLILCGTLLYGLYLIHVQMLSMIHSSLSAWMILLASMLVALSLQKFSKQL